jgi:hypothetical protein
MVQTTKSRKHSNTDLVGFEKNQPVRNEMDEMEPTSRDRSGTGQLTIPKMDQTTWSRHQLLVESWARFFSPVRVNLTYFNGGK